VAEQMSPIEKRRRREAMIHYARWDAVNELRERKDEILARGDNRGSSWEKRYGAVSELFEGTEAEGEPDTIKASYQWVEREIREGRSGQFMIVDPRIDPIGSPVSKKRKRDATE